MNWPFIILTGVAAFLVVRMLFRSRSAIPLDEAKAAVKSGAAVLVDVREAGEWTSGVAKHAALLPFSDLRGARTKWRSYLDKNKGKQLLLYCHSGSRSGMAASQLRGEGFNAVNAGSLRDWDRAGWPVCSRRNR